MMKEDTLRKYFGLLVILVSAPLAEAVAQKASSCAPATKGSSIRANFAGIAAGTDSASIALRALYQLPQVADSAVSLVQDEKVCTDALRALNKDQNASHAQGQRALVVIAVGSVFVVNDPNDSVGEWKPFTVFSAGFRAVLARVAQ